MILFGLASIVVGVALLAYQHGRHAERRAISATIPRPKFVVPLPPRPMQVSPPMPMVSVAEANQRLEHTAVANFWKGVYEGRAAAFRDATKVCLN